MYNVCLAVPRGFHDCSSLCSSTDPCEFCVTLQFRPITGTFAQICPTLCLRMPRAQCNRAAVKAAVHGAPFLK